MLLEKDIKTTLVPGTEFSPNLILTSLVHQFENPAEHHYCREIVQIWRYHDDTNNTDKLVMLTVVTPLPPYNNGVSCEIIQST